MTSDPMVQFVVQIPESMKDAIGVRATADDVAMTDIAREAFAAYLDIEYVKPARTRAAKYDSPEEQKRAAYDRAALIRWGRATGTRLYVAGDTASAGVIFLAVETKDYSTLSELREASEDIAEEAEAPKEEPTEPNTFEPEGNELSDDEFLKSLEAEVE